MSLSDEDKTRIKDLATGKAVNSSMAIEDQLAATREQVAEIAKTTSTPLTEKFQKLQDVVTDSKKGRP